LSCSLLYEYSYFCLLLASSCLSFSILSLLVCVCLCQRCVSFESMQLVCIF
jgi:hypothetical protein